MNKIIEIESFPVREAITELKYIHIGSTLSIINGRTREGEEKMTEYRKVSDTHVQFVRNYLYS
jgi:hypothetical protein